MEELIHQKKQLKTELIKYKKIIFEIENQLMDIEKDIVSFTDMEILDTLVLSPQQKTIVESTEKNILVVACPGSGKTHTLISRYIHLVIKNNINQDNIILITFTKKAGQEMNDRINNVIPNKLPHYVGTLHGLGYRLLQQYNKINYIVLDESEAHALLKEKLLGVMENEDLLDTEINSLKNQIVNIYDKSSTDYPINLDKTLQLCNVKAKYKKIINKTFIAYKKSKKEQDLIDFNDLMIQFAALLNSKKTKEFIDKIEYIFFDEYQDINPIQNYILSKFNHNTNIMAVGDDAQAIYAFRGSSIKYIWDFEKNFSLPDNMIESGMITYYLETNYRSTPNIVTFCQDIISNNTNQYKKNVVSCIDKLGVNPSIICFDTMKQQYEWVVNDIIKNNNDGVPLNEMAVIARKNKSLTQIECELLGKKIPVTKTLGLALLNKVYIKDFIAFLTILINTKSTVHWKRVLVLHKNITMEHVNHVVEQSNNILNSINNLIETDDFYKNNLSDLVVLLKDIGLQNSLHQKLFLLVNYLTNLWKLKKVRDLENRSDDIKKLLAYFGDATISEFISNIHLNYEVECDVEDTLFLTTAHSAKGLEWTYVYLIDMNSKDFPSKRHSFYKDEIDNFEEERRLFYVASSRAKKFLNISYHQNGDYRMSPFINELNQVNYTGVNTNPINYEYSGYIKEHINNYLSYYGYNKLTPLINKLPHTRTNINTFCKLDYDFNNLRDHFIINKFFSYLIGKMLLIHFPNKVKNMDINHQSIPDKIYYKYKDSLEDWRNMLEDIYYISAFNINSSLLPKYKDMLLSTKAYEYYIQLEKSIIAFIKKKSNPECSVIKCNYNISQGKLKGQAKLLLDNTHLIEIKCSQDDICTFPNTCQALMYGYLLKKKEQSINHSVKNISLYNPIVGTFDTFDVTKFDFSKYKKIIY